MRYRIIYEIPGDVALVDFDKPELEWIESCGRLWLAVSDKLWVPASNIIRLCDTRGDVDFPIPDAAPLL